MRVFSRGLSRSQARCSVISQRCFFVLVRRSTATLSCILADCRSSLTGENHYDTTSSTKLWASTLVRRAVTFLLTSNVPHMERKVHEDSSHEALLELLCPFKPRSVVSGATGNPVKGS